MVKKRKEKPQREVTKRQLSRWQWQKKRQRIIFGSGIFVIAAVLGIVGAGWYLNQYQPRHETVIRVNEVKFDMAYYINALKFYGEGQPPQFIVDVVETQIEQNELVRQGAMELGISISNEEIDEELKSHNPPFNDVHRDVLRSQMLISKLRDEYFEEKVPVSAEQRHIMAMLLESESQAATVRARLEGGEDFAELASELSLDPLSESKEGDLGWQSESVLNILLNTSVPAEYAFSSEVGVLSQPIYDETATKLVGYWLIKVLERQEEPEEAHVQVILLGSEEEVYNVRARLEGGGDFATLAEEFSQDEMSRANGGDVGWVSKDIMSSVFREFVFSAELEIVSEPILDEAVSTKGGYWLLKVVDRENSRKIEDDDRNLLKAKALDEWIEALWDNPENEVESYLNDAKKIWAIKQL